jgi:hypothetical protein
MKKGLLAVSGYLFAVALVLTAQHAARATTFYASSNDHADYVTVDNTAKTMAGYVHIDQAQLDSGAAATITTATINPPYPTDYLNVTFTVNLTNQRHTPAAARGRGSAIPARHTYSFASGGSITLTGYINGRYIKLTVPFAPGSNDSPMTDRDGPNEVQTLVAHYNGSPDAPIVPALGLQSSSFTGGPLQTENNVAAPTSGTMSLGADAPDPSCPVPILPAFSLLATALLGPALVRKLLK